MPARTSERGASRARRRGAIHDAGGAEGCQRATAVPRIATQGHCEVQLLGRDRAVWACEQGRRVEKKVVSMHEMTGANTRREASQHTRTQDSKQDVKTRATHLDEVEGGR